MNNEAYNDCCNLLYLILKEDNPDYIIALERKLLSDVLKLDSFWFEKFRSHRMNMRAMCAVPEKESEG